MKHLWFPMAALIGLLLAPAVQAMTPPALDDARMAAVAAMAPLTKTPAPDLKGKPVVVSFFASWCPPCTAEFRQLNKLRERFAEDDLNIVSLNIFEGHFAKNRSHRLKRFIKRTAPRFPVLAGMDDEALAALFGGVSRIPTVFVYDRHGKPAFAFVHAVNAKKRHATFSELEKIITPLIGK